MRVSIFSCRKWLAYKSHVLRTQWNLWRNPPNFLVLLSFSKRISSIRIGQVRLKMNLLPSDLVDLSLVEVSQGMVFSAASRLKNSLAPGPDEIFRLCCSAILSVIMQLSSFVEGVRLGYKPRRSPESWTVGSSEARSSNGEERVSWRDQFLGSVLPATVRDHPKGNCL